MDYLVKIDRSQKIIYPDWVLRVLHPEFELSGPNQFDLQKDVSLWLHENQKIIYLTGHQNYNLFKKGDILKDCLNLADLLAIQAKGIEVFQSLYKGKKVFAWKSVVENTYGFFNVPYLKENSSEVVLHWVCLYVFWLSNDLALRFSKTA